MNPALGPDQAAGPGRGSIVMSVTTACSANFTCRITIESSIQQPGDSLVYPRLRPESTTGDSRTTGGDVEATIELLAGADAELQVIGAPPIPAAAFTRCRAVSGLPARGRFSPTDPIFVRAVIHRAACDSRAAAPIPRDCPLRNQPVRQAPQHRAKTPSAAAAMLGTP